MTRISIRTTVSPSTHRNLEFEDPTEEELTGASEKFDTMVQQLQNNSDLFFTPANFGALPELWLQAKLTIELQPFHDKMAKILYLVTAELWLRRDEMNIYRTLEGVARSMALRLAEYLARYISRLIRQAKQLTTPHTKCLLYATYWVRPILAELLGRPGKIQIPTKPEPRAGR